MPLPITVPNTFSGATSAIPLSQLDANFTAVVNGVNGIGNGTNSLANVSITGGAIAGANISSSNVTITGGTLNGVSVTNATTITSANVTITGGTINATNVTNAAVITGTSVTGTNLASGNVTITGGTINNTSVTNAATFSSANVTITGGTIANVTLSNVSTAPVRGFMRNRVINGNMQIDQRYNGSLQSVPSGGGFYIVDRWQVWNFGTSTSSTCGRISTGVAGGANNQYAFQVGQNGFDGDILLAQNIEQLNCYDLAGQTVTVSFDAAKSSAGSGFYAGLGTPSAVNSFGPLNASTTTGFSNNYFPGTTVMTNYSFQATVPGSGANGLQILFTNPSGGYNMFIGNVQIEAGSTATPFERRPIGENLLLCQRYYQKLGAYVPSLQAMFSFPTVMRANPTVAGGGSGYSSPNIYTNGVGHSQTVAASQTAMQFIAEL
jgi:hypothetical protein